MKLVMNQGVRNTVGEIARVSEEYDEITRQLANPGMEMSSATDAGFRRERVREQLATLACLLVSHATRGRRYSNMTEYRREQEGW